MTNAIFALLRIPVQSIVCMEWNRVKENAAYLELLMTASKISISALINSQRPFHITNTRSVLSILRNVAAREGHYSQSKQIKL